jgi:hypothetical protein
MRKQIIAAAMGLALSVPAAQATLFDFSYELAGGDILAGQVEGVLQGDNNSVVVSSVLDFATFNGIPGPSLPFVESLDEYFGLGGPLDPIFTLDGSFMDLIACTNSGCFDGFLFAAGSAYAAVVGVPLYNSGISFGAAYEPFDAGRWTLQAVPLPATLPLLLIGAAGIRFARRRAA